MRAELAGRGERERQRADAAVQLALDTLARAGFDAAASGEPVYANGVYVEWMAEPEPRFQLLKPLGLARASGGSAAVRRRPDGVRGSIGWRQFVDGAWVSHNRDNDYLPLPGIERALAERQTDEATTLYYFARTVRVEVADEATIAVLGSFFDDLPAIESAWQEGTLVDAERIALPEAAEPAASAPPSEPAAAVPPATSRRPMPLCLRSTARSGRP